MVEPSTIAGSKVQLQLLPNFDLADPFIFSNEVIASLLAFTIAYLFYRFYRVSGLTHLLGIVIGFMFITFAEILLAVDVWLEFNPELFNMLFWLRLLSLSYGFSFLAISYYYKHREEYSIPLSMRIGALSAIPIMIVITVIVIAPPAFGLPAYNVIDEYFRVFNLFMLGYVFISTLGSIVEQGRKEFVYIPAAYAVLWLGQYSGLLFGLDGSTSAFIAQQIAKTLALALFVGVLYQVMRTKRVTKAGHDLDANHH
jgi:hypothetical protein